MVRGRKLTRCFIALLLLLAVVVGVANADELSPQVIESHVAGSTSLQPPAAEHSLVVQATGWQGLTYRYIVTLTNLSPWTMPAVYVLDRYLPEDPELSEIVHDWVPGVIAPHETVGVVIEFPEGAIAGACHQLEISLADGIGSILMDCGPAGSVTVWDIPLTAEMEAYLVSVPEAPEPAQSVGPSKLGLHVTRNASPDIMKFVREVKPAVVVAVGDVGWLAEVKAASPETVTIGRLLEGDQSFNDHPVYRAREFVNGNAATYLANQGVDYWLGWNEPVIDELWQMEWYAAYEAERVIAMSELGLKAAIGNFSAGCPEADEFAAFLPALEAAKAYGGVLAVHEYSAPSMQDGVGAGIPGHEDNPSFGALTLRYRFWVEHYMRPNDLMIPVVVTEAGIDGGVLRLDPPLFGWREFGGSVPDGVEPQTWESYRSQLSWYDDQLRQDEYVLGFAIFNVGDADGQWASFDVLDKLPDLASVALSKQ